MVELKWMGDNQRLFLKRGYLKEGVTPEQRYKKIADTVEFIVNRNNSNIDNFHLSQAEKEFGYTTKGIGKRFEEYITNNWASFSSPILSNFGELKGLPIACNHGKVYDTLDSIYDGIHEMCMLAKHGAGTAKNFSNIRPKGASISTGGKSEGVMEWIELYAHAISKTTQGSTRRGFLTAYLTVEHEEILQFLDIGTENLPSERQRFFQEITTAVTIPKDWMKSMRDGDSTKREIWAKILKTRAEVGFPYILWEDNCNVNSPKVYKDKGLWIDNSNICNEAVEYCDEEKEFACCLSSVNAYRFDEWKDNPTFIMDMNIMLDCVITEYIDKGKHLAGLDKAIKFAEEHRAIGLGVLGFHSYLQKNMVSIGSLQSFRINNDIFKTLRTIGDKASQFMAKVWGEPTMLEGYGLRNTSRMAQAPTKSTAFIMGDWVSQGIEPIKSNYNEKDLAKVSVENKNGELQRLLAEKGQDTREVWKSILIHNGSVQHLDFLSVEEREVFKTFPEVSQVDLIKLASQRQKYIDMGQSLNIMIHPETSPKEINKLHLLAYDSEIKGLYYQYSINAAQEFTKDLLTCSSCEG